jgi:hypothetical protein
MSSENLLETPERNLQETIESENQIETEDIEKPA